MTSETEKRMKWLIDKFHTLLAKSSDLDEWENHKFASDTFRDKFGVSRENTEMNRLSEAEMLALITRLEEELPNLELTVAQLEARHRSFAMRSRALLMRIWAVVLGR